jgi:hypothetical protein
MLRQTNSGINGSVRNEPTHCWRSNNWKPLCSARDAVEALELKAQREFAKFFDIYRNVQQSKVVGVANDSEITSNCDVQQISDNILHRCHRRRTLYTLSLPHQSIQHNHAFLHHCPPHRAQVFCDHSWQVSRPVLRSYFPQILRLGARHGTDKCSHLSFRIPIGVLVILFFTSFLCLRLRVLVCLA